MAEGTARTNRRGRELDEGLGSGSGGDGQAQPDDRRDGNGWIEQSSSAYGASVLFVPKPDGSLRICIDYRGLNKITVKNKFPMPRIDDVLDNLSDATHFNTLDLAAGYHQAPGT